MLDELNERYGLRLELAAVERGSIRASLKGAAEELAQLDGLLRQRDERLLELFARHRVAAWGEEPVPGLDRAPDPPGTVSTKFRVLVTNGPDAGLSRDLSSRTLRIGSAPDNDLVLSDQTVSRHHCLIEPVPTGVRIRDEGSRTGVIVRRLSGAEAAVEGLIVPQLGDTRITVAPLENAPPEGPSAERFGDLFGRSPRMRELFALLGGIAASDYPRWHDARSDALDAFERAYLEALLRRTSSNFSRAAESAGLSRQVMQKLMKKHQLG